MRRPSDPRHSRPNVFLPYICHLSAGLRVWASGCTIGTGLVVRQPMFNPRFDEGRLLSASLQGDREAFGMLVERYQSLACGIAYSMTGNVAASEEVAQEAFLRAWRSLTQLRGPDHFRPWFVAIVRNLARSHLRKQTRRAELAGVDEPVEAVSGEATPDEAAMSRERAAIMWSALESVPKTYREPMVLFYRQGRNVKQVAEELDLSEKAVRQRLSRGRRLLRAEVAGLVEDFIEHTGPKKAFAVAVIAALPALVPGAASAAVAGAAIKGGTAAKGTLTAGLTGAVLGPVLGLLGGIFGAWMSIRNTRSPKERAFMAKMAVAFMAEVLVVVAVVFFTLRLSLRGIVSRQVYWTVFGVLMGAHFVLLVPAILWANRRQRRIQRENGTYVEPRRGAQVFSPSNVLGAFAGSVIGGLAWLEVMALLAHDWLTAILVAAAAVVVFSSACWSRPTDQRGYWRRVSAVTAALLTINLVTVNLRWETWWAVLSDRQKQMGHIPQSVWVINGLLLLVFGPLVVLFLVRGRRQGDEQGPSV